MASPNFSIGLTPEFSASIREIYRIAREESKSRTDKFTRYGLLAAPLAITLWEAFLNEKLLSKVSQLWLSEEIFNKAQNIADSVERLEIEQKSLLLPEILFGKTYRKNEQPFQDFSKLVKIRNSIIHYKMSDYPKTSIQDLRQRKILLVQQDDSEMPWTMEICSLEFIRWCNDTIALMSEKLTSFYPPNEDNEVRITYLQF